MSAYYNEHDAFAAAWLRELITDGLIAPGDVDERDIQQVQADDLRKYTQCHFFAGIGGWSFAFRLAGWPDDRPVWSGSCPCQPLSSAGRRQGHADERHLWPAFHRLIAERRPPVVFGEQVAGALGYEWLAGIRADLEGDRYAVGGADLCAPGVGAPHIRQRLWWVADSLRRGTRHAPGQSVGAQATSDGEDGHLSGQRLRTGLEGASGSRLADANGRLAGHGYLQRGGQHGQRPQDGGADERMDDAAGDGRREDGRHVDSPARCGEGARHAAGSGADHGLGNAHVEGSARQPFGLLGAGDQGHWSNAVAIECSDGKARRVEPGVFPLAHGVPNRMGTLRGAGNAIVPQVAAQFIGAYLDVKEAA